MTTRSAVAAGSIVALAGFVTATTLPAVGATTPTVTPTTIHLVESGGGLKIVDNLPKAKHPYDFSAGDIVVVSRVLKSPGGAAAGHLRLTCIATTPATQQCNGTAHLADGQIEFSGVSSASPTTQIAVIGGTGSYAGARGSAIATDRHGHSDVADLEISLLA